MIQLFKIQLIKLINLAINQETAEYFDKTKKKSVKLLMGKI